MTNASEEIVARARKAWASGIAPVRAQFGIIEDPVSGRWAADPRAPGCCILGAALIGLPVVLGAARPINDAIGRWGDAALGALAGWDDDEGTHGIPPHSLRAAAELANEMIPESH